MQEILVMVHIGSALGSADYNLGKFEARAARDELAFQLSTWNGHLLVIHGELSDELPDYPELQEALNEALARNRAAGYRAEEMQGCDNGTPDSEHNQESAVEAWVTQHAWDKSDTAFEVSGAWYHPEEEGGCVGSVIDRLRELGYQANVSYCAVELYFNEPEDDLEDDEPEPAPEPAPAPVMKKRGPRP